jgi:transposase InsO family protein
MSKARRRQAPSFLAAAAGALGHMIESFWGRMQTELFNRRKWRTRLELANAIFEYLEISHNRRRRHSALGMLTPIEYEPAIQHPGSGKHGTHQSLRKLRSGLNSHR